MDDIFEILIYVVILVIGGIVSATRNKNKRKSVLRPPAPTHAEPVFDNEPAHDFNPFEDFLKKYEVEEEHDSTPEYESLETIPEHVFQPEEAALEENIASQEQDTDSSAFSDKEDISSFIEYLDKDNMISAGQITDAIADEDMVHESRFNFSDDIRLGIIYSEILKRKQF